MTILVLDSRWPEMIPRRALGRILAPVEFAPEVPISLRWDFDELITAKDPSGTGTFVTMDPDERGDGTREVIRATSLDDPVDTARRVMHAARSLGEWEAAQTHESLLPYLEEESREFTEAVRAGASDEELKKELGDVFLQVLFHAEIASRRSAFDLSQVAQSFVDKMRSRAPYLFDGTTEMVEKSRQDELWALGKQNERTRARP